MTTVVNMSIKQKIEELRTEYINLTRRVESKDFLHLTIRTRKEVLFDGDVWAVASVNEVGVFSILPQHANFVTIIKDNLSIIKPNKQTLNFQLKTGLIKVWENSANAFLDIQSPVTV